MADAYLLENGTDRILLEDGTGVLLLEPPKVTFDAVGPSSAGAGGAGQTSPLTWSHTCTGSNRLLLVGVAFGYSAFPTTVTATYNGVSMTSLGTVASGGGTSGKAWLFGLLAPATGANTVSVAYSGGTPGGSAAVEAGSVSYTNVDQTDLATAITNFTTANNSNSANPSVAVTSAVGNMVASLLVMGGSITSAGDTQRWLKNVNSGTAGGNGAQSDADGASSVTMDWTAPTESWGLLGVNIVAVSGAGTTPIGVESQLVWDIRAALGDTLQAVWDVRAELGDTVQLVWDVRSVLGDEVQLVWDVRAAAGQSSQLVWDVRAAVGDTLQLIWDLGGTIGKDSQLVWDVRSILGDTVQLVWDDRAAVGQASQLVWDVRAAIGDTIQLVWDLAGTLGKDLQLVWDVRAAVADTLQLVWDVRQALGDTTQLVWDVRAAVGDTVQVVWDVRSVAGDEVQLVWDVQVVAVGDGPKVVYLLLDRQYRSQWTLEQMHRFTLRDEYRYTADGYQVRFELEEPDGT